MKAERWPPMRMVPWAFALLVVVGVAQVVMSAPSYAQSADMTFSQASIDFGTVPQGAVSAPQQITITANTALTINTVFDGLTVGQGVYGISADTCTGATLQAGQSCTFAVSFSTASLFGDNYTMQPIAGEIEAGYTVPTDATPRTANGTTLSGNQGPPTITVIPDALAFGEQTLQTGSTPLQATVSTAANVTFGAAKIQASQGGTGNPADYTIDSNTCVGSLTAGGTCTIAVHFHPSQSGLDNVAIGLQWQQGSFHGSTAIALYGVGTIGAPQLTFTPPNLNFATAASPQLVTFRAASSLTVNSVYAGIQSSQAALWVNVANPYPINSDTCTGVALTAGQTCSVGVSFTAVSQVAPGEVALCYTPSGSPTQQCLDATILDGPPLPPALVPEALTPILLPGAALTLLALYALRRRYVKPATGTKTAV